MLATMSYLYISDMLNRYVIWLTVYVYNMLLSNFDDMKLLFLIVQKKKNANCRKYHYFITNLLPNLADLAGKIDAATGDDRPRKLNLLRGFFYWLKVSLIDLLIIRCGWQKGYHISLSICSWNKPFRKCLL